MVRSLAGVLAAAVLLVGCGAATTHKDAEEAASIAAEGALLAHDAAEGAATPTFTRIHAGELRKRAESIARRRRATRLGEIGARVARELGRVHDVRAELGPRTLRITGLVVGGAGILERLGIGAPQSTARIRTRDVVPWSAVVRANRGGIVVRDGTEPR